MMGLQPDERCQATPGRPLVLATSAKCSEPVLLRAREVIAAPTLHQAGGSANKVLAVFKLVEIDGNFVELQ